jgi:hypothetical protein
MFAGQETIITKRNLFGLFAGSTALLLLARCGGQNANLDAQILADAQGLESATTSLETLLTQYAPNALTADQKTQIATLEAAIVSGLNSLTTTTPAPAGATTLQVIDSDINQVLAAIGGVLPGAAATFPALAPAVPIYDAAVAILPVIEAYVNSLIPAATAAAAPPPKFVKTDYSGNIAGARAILHIQKAQ